MTRRPIVWCSKYYSFYHKILDSSLQKPFQVIFIFFMKFESSDFKVNKKLIFNDFWIRFLILVQSATSSALVLLCVYVLHKGRLERPRFCLTAVGLRYSPARRDPAAAAAATVPRAATLRAATATVPRAAATAAATTAAVVPRESMNGACFHSWNRRRHCRRHHRRRRCCCYDDTLWPWLLVGHKLQRPAHAISSLSPPSPLPPPPRAAVGAA